MLAAQGGIHQDQTYDDLSDSRRRPSSVPSAASIAPANRPFVIHPSVAGPSVSARTSFTRVGADDEDGPLFPARPATASASVATPQLHLLRPRLFDLPSGSVISLHSNGHPSEPESHPNSDPAEGSMTGAGAALMPILTDPLSSSPQYHPQPNLPATVPQTPQTFVTFLLVTNRRRTMAFDSEMTVGRVKELVWNTWPEDNDWQSERPPAPSYLRLLYLGKMLQDDDTLSKLKLPVSNPSSPQATIIHLSIRPYAPTADNEPNKKRRLSRRLSGNDASGCCGCIIC
ncbi:hypothetical protein AX15_005483 [Amanita polypyramis BW_CC]|nr:hypothetical protein AX15_005483 [Amanita polypyramis BW_CC]